MLGKSTCNFPVMLLGSCRTLHGVDCVAKALKCAVEAAFWSMVFNQYDCVRFDRTGESYAAWRGDRVTSSRDPKRLNFL